MLRSLLILSDLTFKMTGCWPYRIFWFPDSNFILALKRLKCQSCIHNYLTVNIADNSDGEYRSSLSIHLSHCFPIFPWLCAWDVCYIILCHSLYIHSGKAGNLFSLGLCSLWWVQIVGYVLACRSYSVVCTLHHLIIIIAQTLSEDIELIKCLSDIICRVCEKD